MRRDRLTYLIVATFGCGSAIASAAPAACPATLRELPQVVDAPPGWIAVTEPGERPLERVSVALGPADAVGDLVPDTTRTRGGVQRSRWRLVHAPGDRFWWRCSYAGTRATLLRQIEPEATWCVVATAVDVRSAPAPIGADCTTDEVPGRRQSGRPGREHRR